MLFNANCATLKIDKRLESGFQMMGFAFCFPWHGNCIEIERENEEGKDVL